MSSIITGKPGFIGNAMDSVLLVYNTASSDSFESMKYYTNFRPFANNVDILAINCVTTEQITYAAMKTDIKAPIATWLSSNPTRPKKYVILCMGIPTRTTVGPSGVNVSVAYGISTGRSDSSIAAGPNVSSEYGATGIAYWGGDGGINNTHYSIGSYPNTSFLVTHLCMGNTLAAVKKYVDKLANMYASMASPNVTISSVNASRNGTNWYYDDAQSPTIAAGQITSHYNLITGTDGLSTSLAVSQAFNATPLTSGSNPASIMSWGVHSGTYSGSWPFNGNLTMTGNANWYIVSAIESFNGQLAGGHGDYAKWWNDAALGGAGGSRTPVGMVGHTEEPLASGVEAESYTRNWFKSLNFVECAWSARSTPYFIAVGDPLVVW